MRRGTLKHSRKAGLTLVELVVTLGIATMLMTITVANHRAFQLKVVLENLTQDVALSLRLAQTYGMNVRGDSGADPFSTSYGVHFESASPSTYLIFKDLDRGLNGFEYTGNVVEEFTLGGGYTIKDVCGWSGAVSKCYGAISDFDITFDRPKPDANFRASDGSTNHDKVVIIIQNPIGVTKEVHVLTTGYINVQ